MKSNKMNQVRIAGKAKGSTGQVWLFIDMVGMRTQSFVCLFKKLLSVAANCSDSLFVFDEMRSVDLCTMKYCLDAMVVLTEELLFEKVLVLELCEPNEVTYCIVIDGLCFAK